MKEPEEEIQKGPLHCSQDSLHLKIKLAYDAPRSRFQLGATAEGATSAI